jgi:hypothetical protein
VKCRRLKSLRGLLHKTNDMWNTTDFLLISLKYVFCHLMTAIHHHSTAPVHRTWDLM